MADTQKNTIDTPCSAYNTMALHWDLINDLLGGTLAMRAAGRKWLPIEPKEEELSYSNRLDRSILFTAYADTIDDLASRPFSKPVTIQGELPENLADLPDNCDGEGTGLTQFARSLFDACLNYGLTHILVDYPLTAVSQGQTLTLADEQRSGFKPYFVHIKPNQLIGWKWEKGKNGKPQLTQIRWKISRTEPSDSYGEKTINEIRVMTLNTWEIHTANDKGEYSLTQQGTHTYPDGIPLVTCYVNKTGFMTARPPLEGLAWLNLAHWQGYSDQKNLLRFIRFPLLFFKGIAQEEIDKSVIIGPGRKFSSSNPNADAKFLEHSGAGADAGRQDLKDTEERMSTLGLEPLMSRSGGQTATGQAIDESKSQSSIQAWIRSQESAITNLFKMAARWVGGELPDDFKLDIYNDFGVSIRAAADIDALIKMRQGGEIDRETFLREVKRRALLSEMTDITSVMQKIDEEGPPLASFGRDANNNGGGAN